MIKKLVKKDVYNELVKKANAIDTSLLLKIKDYDAKIYEIKGKIPSIAGLATIAALNAVDNKKNLTSVI